MRLDYAVRFHPQGNEISLLCEHTSWTTVDCEPHFFPHANSLLLLLSQKLIRSLNLTGRKYRTYFFYVWGSCSKCHLILAQYLWAKSHFWQRQYFVEWEISFDKSILLIIYYPSGGSAPGSGRVCIRSKQTWKIVGACISGLPQYRSLIIALRFDGHTYTYICRICII
jgi:hypothetical protein